MSTANNHGWRAATVGMAIVCAICWLDVRTSIASDPDRFALALLEGSVANLERFTAFRCEYTVRQGMSKSVQDAVQGKFERSDMYEVEWLVKEDKESWSFRADDASVESQLRAEAGKGAVGRVAGPWPSEFYLSNGPQQLGYSPALKLANVHTPESPRSPTYLLPPVARGIGPGNKIDNAKDLLKSLKEGKTKHEGTDMFRGAEVHQFRERIDDGVYLGSLDPRRGYLLVRQVSTTRGDVEQSIHEIITEAKECEDGKWFPIRAYEIIAQSNLSQVFAREFVVTRLEDQKPPADEEFVVMLPRGTRVVLVHDSMASFSVPANMPVGLDDIDKLLERGAAARKEREKNGSGAGLVWWCLGGGLLALVCIVGLWRRQRRLSRPA